MARYDNIFEYENDLAGDGLAVGIVMSRFNQDVCEGLLAACTAELKRPRRAKSRCSSGKTMAAMNKRPPATKAHSSKCSVAWL